MSSIQNHIKFIKKGELLFREGEGWGSMYLISKGLIRVFKKKGEQQIELDTLRPGQIIGEMSFLDQQPRSASAEAIMDTEVVEISQAVYQNTFQSIPEWVKVLLKATVARLRATTVKVRNLETASTEVVYNDMGSKRQYVFLSSHDCLKIAMAVLLVSSRAKVPGEKETRLRMLSLERYANQILGIPLSKVSTFLEGLKVAEIIRYSEDGSEIFMVGESDLEAYISFVCEENLLAPEKRHDLTPKAFQIMESIHRYLDRFKKNETTGLTQVNMVQVIKYEMEENGKQPFRLDELDELVKSGYASALSVMSAEDQTTLIQEETFRKVFKTQKVVQIFENLNSEKDRLGKIA
jgi:CRP-like cAMP-binding protein